MKMKSTLLITGAMICSFLLIPSVICAQTPVYTLQQCIEEAVNNNTSLKISRLNVEMQRNTLQQAKASML
ncbi:MAG: TolC family protein, partial [Bacteroidales bacterium]